MVGDPNARGQPIGNRHNDRVAGSVMLLIEGQRHLAAGRLALRGSICAWGRRAGLIRLLHATILRVQRPTAWQITPAAPRDGKGARTYQSDEQPEFESVAHMRTSLSVSTSDDVPRFPCGSTSHDMLQMAAS